MRFRLAVLALMALRSRSGCGYTTLQSTDEKTKARPITPMPARSVQPQPSGAASVRMNSSGMRRLVHTSNHRLRLEIGRNSTGTARISTLRAKEDLCEGDF